MCPTFKSMNNYTTGIDGYQPSSGTVASVLPSWSEVKGTDPRPPYQAFEPRTYPFPPIGKIFSPRIFLKVVFPYFVWKIS